MNIYHYHPVTFEYLGSGIADVSPLDPGQYLIPQFATFTPVPVSDVDHVAVFDVASDSWSVVVDYRGSVYYLSDGSRHEISSIGVTVPTNSYASPSVDSLRSDLLIKLDAERAKRWRAGFPTLIGSVQKWFHSDEFSLTQHLGLKDRARDLLAAGGVLGDSIMIGGQVVSWSTMDGLQVTITAQVAFDLVESAAVQQAMIFAAGQAHRVAVLNSQNLANYDVTAGWPVSFGESA